MGAKSTTSTTVIKRLPDYAQGYAQQMVIRAQSLADPSTYVPFAGPTYAAQTSDELEAIATLASRGTIGNLSISKGVVLLEDILDGIYLLGTDVFMEAAEDAVEDNLTIAINTDLVPLLGGSKFLMGDVEAANLAQSLGATTYIKYFGRAMGRFYADNYKTQRTNQEGALSIGIEFAAQPIKDAETRRIAGVYAREYLQGYDTDLFNKWMDSQVYKVNHLEILGNAVRALVGGQSTRTEPYYRPNPMISAAGGAISGAVSGAMIGGYATSWSGPGMIIGGAIGAVVGGTVGYLSAKQ
jgi:hypothetical protein